MSEECKVEDRVRALELLVSKHDQVLEGYTSNISNIYDKLSQVAIIQQTIGQIASQLDTLHKDKLRDDEISRMEDVEANKDKRQQIGMWLTVILLLVSFAGTTTALFYGFKGDTEKSIVQIKTQLGIYDEAK